ncbi:MAG TPA: hypothetical protein VH255_03780 [Verrucomicrobiae bacterium]|nr:hypothetical protein [Verrucomicrobiae bacterium]
MNPPETGPAPAAPFGLQPERSNSLVLISGIATTVITLLVVYLLDHSGADINIMGLYADYVIPAGTILVGIAASSGYGLASWVSGIKITKRLLWTVLCLQLIAYFVAEYIQFSNLHLIYAKTGQPVGFFTWFDATARAFAWKQDNGSMGEPLGAFGYFFVSLGIAGFVGGSLIVPLAMRKAPYCASCQRYMKTRSLGLVPASVKAKKVKKSDLATTAAYEAEHQQALDGGKQTVAALQKFAADNSSAEFRNKLDELHPNKGKTSRLPVRMLLQLVHCKRCCNGQLVTKQITGQGKRIKTTEIVRSELHPEFVRSVCS